MNTIDYRAFLPVHDFPARGMKWLLESPENVWGLLHLIVPEMVGDLDFSRGMFQISSKMC